MNILKYINFSVLFIFASCIDPVTPYFDFKEDLIIINAIATNVPGATNITVEKHYNIYYTQRNGVQDDDDFL